MLLFEIFDSSVTNQLTNQPTDRASHRGAWSHLKSEIGLTDQLPDQANKEKKGKEKERTIFSIKIPKGFRMFWLSHTYSLITAVS